MLGGINYWIISQKLRWSKFQHTITIYQVIFNSFTCFPIHDKVYTFNKIILYYLLTWSKCIFL